MLPARSKMEQGGMSAHDDEVAYELQMAAAVDATLKDARRKEAQARKTGKTDQKVALEVAMHELRLAMAALEASGSTAGRSATCQICLESKAGRRFRAVKACNHSFCRACLATYVNTKGAPPVRCPQPGCAALLCGDDFRGLKLAPATAALLLLLPGAAEASLDLRVRNEAKFAELVAARGWKACPACRTVIERTGGCNTMDCRCGTVFCYACGEDLARCDGCGDP